MDDETKRAPLGRREFLVRASAAAAGLGLAGAARPAEAEQTAPAALPTIQLGKHRISRLVAGWNPIGGHSHTTLDMARAMREYFTVDRVVEFIQGCERNGITAWQYDHTDKSVEALRKLREKGSQVKTICLHAGRSFDAPLKQVIDETSPIAIVHHGGVTDSLFQAGKSQQVRDFVKKVHDHGVLAGVSAHCPQNIRRMADEGWENDLFMCCFYYVTRPIEEQKRALGKVAVGEPFFESDPGEMTQVMRAVKQPCLGFKILAAGRVCWSAEAVQEAFRSAFASIKPTDGVIVGMFPRYADQVAENAGYARKHGAA